MKVVDRLNPGIRQKTPLRLTVMFNLCISIFFQILFLSGDVVTKSYAHAVDEKPVFHEKKTASSPETLKSISNHDELELVSGYAEDVFDYAKVGKWKKASKKLAALEKIEQRLTDTAHNLGADNLSALTKTTSDLERAVAARNRQDTMITANKITAIAALLAKPFYQRVPTNVLLLDYYGRELEIWSEIKNVNKLSEIVSKMHLTWQVLIPSIIAEGGAKDVKRFGETMKRLATAKTPEEYGRLATTVLDDVENLEKVFTQKP